MLESRGIGFEPTVPPEDDLKRRGSEVEVRENVVHEQAVDGRSAMCPAGRAGRKGRCQMRLLLVEDSTTLRSIERRCLLKAGVKADEIVEAGSAAEALEILRDNAFDLVFTDWHMPQMDGLELAREIRVRELPVTVIIMVTEADRTRMPNAYAAGVNDFAVKPLNPRVLNENLTRWLVSVP